MTKRTSAQEVEHKAQMGIARQFARDILMAEGLYTRAAVSVARLFLELDAENEDLKAARPEAMAQEARKEWLIWSNEHRAWWGPGHCGYPRDVRLAGRYTLAEANAICTQRSWEDLNVPPETMIHLRAVIGDELYGQCMNSCHINQEKP